jgi:serine/threonine-protein kinase
MHLFAQIDHPHISRLFDRGRTKSGAEFLVTDFIEGEHIDDYVGRIGNLRDVIRLFIQVAQAVSAVHAQGIVHGDLKPSNILVDSRGQPHVIDFGVTIGLKQTSAESERIMGGFSGTPRYMAPEQFQNSDVDFRSDIYSLGLTMWKCLFGNHPFGELNEPFEQIKAKANTGTLPEAANSRWAPRRVLKKTISILNHCVQKNPNDRYASAALLAEDLENASINAPLSVAEISWVSTTLRRIKRNKPMAIMAALTAISLLAAVVSIMIMLFRLRK